jgi:hypothetical protein
MMLFASIACCFLAVIPTITFLVNLRFFHPPRHRPAGSFPSVSILIPARDEAAHIGRALEAVLQSRDIIMEVIVLDDHSTDATAQIVRDISQRDSRVRLAKASELPTGWCGKQHACWELAQLAAHDVLIFMDADVEPTPDAFASLAAELTGGPAGLVSMFPRQITISLSEQLVIPLMHLVLLGFLPIWQMRRSSKPSLAAGCGQIFAARKGDYFTAGGHSAIASSRHDGITLPRAFRKHGIMTDIFDGTRLASCRMYSSSGQLIRGLAKNATEGLASPQLILPATMMLFGGQVLPVILWISSLISGDSAASLWAGIATLMTIAVRLIAAAKFDQSIPGALLNPVGIIYLLAIEWYAFWCHLTGKSIAWRGRIP